MAEAYATKLGYLFALSRTPHAIIDLAAPLLAATLWLGHFPDPAVAALGLLTVFSAYTAVYALNDLVDIRRDMRRIAAGCPDPDGDLDASLLLHPIAQGCISFKLAFGWTFFWSLVALVGAFLLNPVCAALFVVACVLEAVYCILADVTSLRTAIAGVVKSAGPLAAIVAVDPSPAPLRLLLFFGWAALWEVGGQNIPNDWADMQEDSQAGLQTVPIATGPRTAAAIVVAALVGSIILSTMLPSLGFHRASETGGPGPYLLYLVGAVVAGGCFLLRPALRLAGVAWKTGRAQSEIETDQSWASSPLRQRVLTLFNRASYYPLVLLGLVTLYVLLIPSR